MSISQFYFGTSAVVRAERAVGSQKTYACVLTIDSLLAKGEGISCIETNHTLHTHIKAHL